MNYFEKVKNLVLDLEYDITHEEEATGILVINKEVNGICDMVLDCEDSILVLEQIIFPVKEDNAEYYKQLLQMNRNLIHGAFVLNSNQNKDIITFRDTLELENLDSNELAEALNALSYALAENMDALLAFAK